MLSAICDRTSPVHDCAGGCGRARSVLSIRARAGGFTVSNSATLVPCTAQYLCSEGFETPGVLYDRDKVVVARGRTVHVGGNQYRRMLGWQRQRS
jgi:hypothetical protein